jgi:lipoprotein-anchoring transpeptidase ErfK/SrfK
VSKDLIIERAAPCAASALHHARVCGRKLGAVALGATLAMVLGGSAHAAYPYIVTNGGLYYVVPQPQYVPVRKKVRRHRAPDEAEHAKNKKEPARPVKGPLTLVVSIGDQRVRVYDSTAPIAEAPVSTGMKGHPTPTGVFSVIQKEKWHRSNIYSGAPMPYMQRITWSGVALHAGVLPGYPASHGCIRMPADFATRLYGMTKMGTRVIVARHGVAPAEFTHPKLALLKKRPEPAPVAEPAKPADKGADAGANPDLAGKTASATVSVTDGVTAVAATTNEEPKAEPPAVAPALPLVEFGPPRPLKPGPVAIFVSKKEGKLFVRKGFEPLFQFPVKFARPNEPLGTHVYTATEFQDDGQTLRWIALSLPPEPKAEPRVEVRRIKGRLVRETRPAPAAHLEAPASAQEALDRVELPQEALDRLAELMSPGANLTVSDKGLGGETGLGTDFIVLSR